MISKFCGVLLFVGVFFSCRKIVPPQPFGKQYSQNKSTTQKIYEIDSVVFSRLQVQPDTFHYFVRETLTNETNIDSNTIQYFKEEWCLDTLKGPWKFKARYFVRINNYASVIHRFNIPICSLVFPVANKKKWDKNAFNDEPMLILSYSAENESSVVNNVRLDNTISVVAEEIDDVVETLSEKYTYAKDLGLIYEEVFYRNNNNKTGHAFKKILLRYQK